MKKRYIKPEIEIIKSVETNLIVSSLYGRYFRKAGDQIIEGTESRSMESDKNWWDTEWKKLHGYTYDEEGNIEYDW